MPGAIPGDTATDFVVVVSRDEGRWAASTPPLRVGDDLDALVAAMRQEWSDVGTFGFVSVAEDFFVTVRVGTHGDVHLLLSDSTAALEWPIARQVLDRLGLPVPSDDDLDDMQPAGDLGLFADLGLGAGEVEDLLGDIESFPDEMLSDIAGRLGFGDVFERALDDALD
ncbi:MAG: tRNA adenosine deaminase-associated protein [Actinomycetes bacterium]